MKIVTSQFKINKNNSQINCRILKYPLINITSTHFVTLSHKSYMRIQVIEKYILYRPIISNIAKQIIQKQNVHRR